VKTELETQVGRWDGKKFSPGFTGINRDSGLFLRKHGWFKLQKSFREQVVKMFPVEGSVSPRVLKWTNGWVDDRMAVKPPGRLAACDSERIDVAPIRKLSAGSFIPFALLRRL
jgi:hypothetical protein